MHKHRIAPLLLPLMLASATGVKAADPAGSNPPTAADATAAPQADALAPEATAPEAARAAGPDTKWHFATIGYVFFAGAFGESTPRRPLPPVKVDLPFGDVLKVFKFGFMGAADARKGRLVFLGDLMWVHLGGSQGLSVRNRPDIRKVTVNTKAWEVTALAGYRVLDKGPVIMDLMAGGRLNGQRQAITYNGPLLNLSASLSKTWIDPIVATRVFVPLGQKFSLSGYGDIGGFGVGSHLTWQALGTVNYQINRKMRLGVGWRYFKINYEDHDGFLYDIAQSGPIIGLRTDF
jgi:hypothetical protein